jgi:hypothetical protein
MSAFTTLSINDGLATPVAHSFAPKTLIGNRAEWTDRVTGISVGYPTLMLDLSLPSKNQRFYKTRIKFGLPVMEVINASTYNGILPAPQKAFDLSFDGVFFIHERATLASRKDLLAYVKNSLLQAPVVAAIEGQEAVY